MTTLIFERLRGFRRQRRHGGHGLPLLTIFLAGLAAYFNSFTGGFHFDGPQAIVNNPDIFDIGRLFAHLGRMEVLRLTGYLSFALNYAVNGLDPFGYHVINFFLHIINAWLVRWFVLLLFQSPRMQDSELYPHREGIAWTSALLFVCHPLSTQAVTYIYQRFTLLATAFYLATICLYFKGRCVGKTGKPSLKYWIAAWGTAVLAFFSKENAFTLPFMIALIEGLLFFERKDAMYWRRHVWQGCLAGAAVGLLLLVIPVCRGISVPEFLSSQSVSRLDGHELITKPRYILTQLKVVILYLRLLFVPWGQSLHHDVGMAKSFFEWPVFLSFGACVSILACAFGLRRRRPLVALGIFWFFIALFVESVAVLELVFEHRVYLPSVGFFLLLSVVLFLFIDRPRIRTGIISAVTIVLIVLTHQRNKVWLDPVVFWKDAVEAAPHQSRPYDNLAAVYIARGEPEKALGYLRRAFVEDPGNYENHINFGLVYLQQGNLDLAEAYFRRAINLNSSNEGVAYHNLGLVLMRRGDLAGAQSSFEQALSINRRLLEPRLALARVLETMGETQSARDYYREAYDLFPHNAEAVFHVSRLLLEAGRYEDAEDIMRGARGSSFSAVEWANLGSLFAMHRRTQPAIRCYERAIRSDPEAVIGYVEMGKLLANTGHLDEAIRLWEKATALAPENMDIPDLIERARELLQR